jgi:hypothetical protein
VVDRKAAAMRRNAPDKPERRIGKGTVCKPGIEEKRALVFMVGPGFSGKGDDA